jgi:hypothetical protein
MIALRLTRILSLPHHYCKFPKAASQIRSLSSSHTLAHSEALQQYLLRIKNTPVSVCNPLPQEDSPIIIAEHISACLTTNNVAHAIGGALAHGVWSTPRATFDVDVNIWFTSSVTIDSALDVLQQNGLVVHPTQPTNSSAILLWAKKVKVDIFTPNDVHQQNAQQDLKKMCLRPKGPLVPVLSAESITIFKLIFFRSKDESDIRHMLSNCQNLDLSRVRSAIVGSLGEDDDRIKFWDRAVSKEMEHRLGCDESPKCPPETFFTNTRMSRPPGVRSSHIFESQS